MEKEMQGDYPQGERRIYMFIPALSSFTTMMGGGDFGGGVDHPCPIPGPQGQVVHRGSGCLIGQFQIQSTDVLTILGPTEFQGSLSFPPVLQHKMYFRYFVTYSSFKKA